MKKTIFIVGVLLCCQQLMGQTGLHIGLVAGGQYTMMLNNQPIIPGGKGFKYVPTFGKTGTFKLGYNFVPPIGIQVGVTYSDQGQDYKTVDSLGVESLTSRRVTYIKIPVMIHMSSTPGPVMFTMDIGPQFGMLRRASISVDGTPLTFSFPTTLLWKPTDIEFAWAVGAEFGLTKGVHLVVQHRGDYGIFDFENKNVGENGVPFYPANRQKANNLAFGIVGGINFVVTGAHSKVTRHYKGRTWHNNWR